MSVSLEQARVMVRETLATGRLENMMPLTVVVLDSGGHMVALEREDGSGIMRVEIASGKAWGALGFGEASRTMRDRLADRPSFVAGLAAASGGRFVPVPGGVLIRAGDAAGPIIGAIGVSGDTSDRDEYCAIAGVKAAALLPEPEEADEAWRASKL
ncbi:MAG: heme-binding protein [Chromatiales bacterium]|jgi:uncharacterized protein GlcG (DUF336 family)|nr:heme-binding protein [Chromatiales bacterium]